MAAVRISDEFKSLTVGQSRSKVCSVFRNRLRGTIHAGRWDRDDGAAANIDPGTRFNRGQSLTRTLKDERREQKDD